MISHVVAAAAVLKAKISNDFKEVHIDNSIEGVMFENLGCCEMRPITQWNGGGGVSISVVELSFDIDTIQLVVAHMTDKYAKIYRGIADIDLPILNMVTGLNVVAKMNTRWTALCNKGNRELICDKDGRSITFFDGTVLECLMGDSFVPQVPSPFPSEPRRPHRFVDAQPKHPQQSMFGDPATHRPHPAFDPNGGRSPGEVNDELNKLRKELNVLTQYVNDNLIIDFAGIKLKRMGVAPCFGDREVNVIEGASVDMTLHVCDDTGNADYTPYVKLKGEWFSCPDATAVEVAEKWYEWLLSTPEGLVAIEKGNTMHLGGALFVKITRTQLEDLRPFIDARQLRGWNKSCAKAAVTSDRHGRGYLVLSIRNRERWFHFDATKFNFEGMTDEILTHGTIPMTSGYAHTTPTIKPFDEVSVQAARKAVRATIVQAGKEKLTYRRLDQKVIGRDFEIEVVCNHEEIGKALHDVVVHDLYRFRMSNGICIYVHHDATEHAKVLDLKRYQYECLDAVKGYPTENELTDHCQRLAKLITL